MGVARRAVHVRPRARPTARARGEVDVVGVGHRPASSTTASGRRAGLVGVGRARRRGERPAERSSRRRPGILDIYVRGTDNQLYQKYWTPSTGWSDFIPLGGGLTSGVAATAWDQNRRDIFARGGSSALIRSCTSHRRLGQLAAAGRRRGSAPGPTSSARAAWRSSPAGRRVHRHQQLLEHLVGLAQPRPRPALSGAPAPAPAPAPPVAAPSCGCGRASAASRRAAACRCGSASCSATAA